MTLSRRGIIEAKGHTPSKKNHEKSNSKVFLIPCILFTVYGILLFSELMILSPYDEFDAYFDYVRIQSASSNSNGMDVGNVTEADPTTDLISMIAEESNLEINRKPIYHHVQVTQNATRVVEPATVQTFQEQSLLRGRDGSRQSGTFYSFLQSNECLPVSSCSSCLNMGKTCQQCTFCGCFCEHLCKVSNENIQHVFDYHLIPDRNPAQQHHPMSNQEGEQRLIPKIVHQTWKENITKELYPKKSIFQSSWKQRDWEYRFYNDDDVLQFLKLHFPPQVLEAYNTLIPGAFKADLFRYCVLFIYGGVYADYDVLCETDLDQAIDPEVGFFVPVDIDRCLWNGLIGSAPGHPFMAAAIETVVNYVRNRYTAVDIMNSVCHEGKVDKFDVSHEDLHLSGPCLLGKVVNQVLGRPPQSTYNVHSTYDSILQSRNITGSLQLLEFQKNHFLGGERFMLHSKNLIVAATTFGDAKDEIEKKSPGNHYSGLIPNKRGRIFGSFDVYQDMNSVNEDIKLVLATSKQ